MTYKDFQELDYATLAYYCLLINLALYQQTPVNAIIFDADKTHQCLIVFKSTSNGKICTKRITVQNKMMPSILSNLLRDFPNIDIKHF